MYLIPEDSSELCIHTFTAGPQTMLAAKPFIPKRKEGGVPGNEMEMGDMRGVRVRWVWAWVWVKVALQVSPLGSMWALAACAEAFASNRCIARAAMQHQAAHSTQLCVPVPAMPFHPSFVDSPVHVRRGPLWQQLQQQQAKKEAREAYRKTKEDEAKSERQQRLERLAKILVAAKKV